MMLMCPSNFAHKRCFPYLKNRMLHMCVTVYRYNCLCPGFGPSKPAFAAKSGHMNCASLCKDLQSTFANCFIHTLQTFSSLRHRNVSMNCLPRITRIQKTSVTSSQSRSPAPFSYWQYLAQTESQDIDMNKSSTKAKLKRAFWTRNDLNPFPVLFACFHKGLGWLKPGTSTSSQLRGQATFPKNMGNIQRLPLIESIKTCQ